MSGDAAGNEQDQDISNEQETTSATSKTESTESNLLDCYALMIPDEVQGRNITVKFRSHGEYIFTGSYYENITVGDLKDQLTDVFNMPSYSMELYCDGRVTTNDELLSSLNVGLFNIVDLELVATDETFKNYVFSLGDFYEDYGYPDIITVKIVMENGESRDVTVEIEHKEIIKPFLGGFLNVKSGIEYHNAYSQTGPPQKKGKFQSNRDTQTYWLRNRKLVTSYSRATQMANEEIWIPNVTDRVVKAGKYVTAEELERIKDMPGKVKTIQRYYRAWKLRRALKDLSDEYNRRCEEAAKEAEFLKQWDEKRRKRELIAKIFPRTKSDFCMLYSMLDRWKKSELDRIITESCGPARIAEMYLLLEKEIEMLRTIDQHRKTVVEDVKIQQVEDFFKIIGEPIQWESDYKKLVVTMDSLETQKGREYYQVFLELNDKKKSVEARLKILLDVKSTLENDNCDVAIDLVELIDRECNLITRGISDKHLDILHKRIEGLYLKHLKLPDCSFGVTNRMNRTREKLMEDNIFYCQRCHKLKTHEEFPLDSKTKSLRVCKHCSFDDKIMEPWIDVAPYRFILRKIRREERQRRASSSISFIMTEKNIVEIVTTIWHKHSAISECDDIYKLRLVRFFKDEDWAPWNTVLLTEEESKEHLKVKKLDEVYDKEFLHHVYNKHLLAKQYFTKALQLEKYYNEIGKVDTRWNEIIEEKHLLKVTSKPKVFLSCH